MTTIQSTPIRRTRIGTILATTVCLLWTALAAGAAESGPAEPEGALAPVHGALFGTTIGLVETSGLSLQHLEKLIGRSFDVVQRYYDWGQKLVTVNEIGDAASGRIPMISWRTVRLRRILSGKYDYMIGARATALRNFGHPVFLRWGWEMNGNWEVWSGSRNGHDPAEYRRAWRHVHRIFDRVGASNVVWVWAVNWEDVPKESWNHFTKYYPGDAYVDWVGIDGYNWGTLQSWSSWTDIDAIIQDVYDTYRGEKPIMVAETGSVEKGGDKAAWIHHARVTIERNFPAVRAFIYYNGRDRNQPVNWKVTSSSSALAAYRQMGLDPYFRVRSAR